MRLLWQVEEADIDRVRTFYEEYKDCEFVVDRWKLNVERGLPEFSHGLFWRKIVSCLVTTQARSGPGSAVAKFTGVEPFPLDYELCKQEREVETFAQKTLVTYHIRRNITIARQLQHNLQWLESGGWDRVNAIVADWNQNQTPAAEIKAADSIDDCLSGFGPKQSRNLLQELGLTKYEIPIDSRITKWLNDYFEFPVRLSATGLGDRNYYRFVSEGFQELCKACDIYPCMLDAAIFFSFDNDVSGREHLDLSTEPKEA